MKAVRLLVLCALLSAPALSSAQAPVPTPDPTSVVPQVTVSLPSVEGPEQVVPALKILGLLTILSIAPAILISMTSFTRIVIVLSFLKQALGAQNAPPTQVLMALSLLLTAVVMAPVAKQVDEQALSPYSEGTIGDKEALDRTKVVVRDWLLRHTREPDVALFYSLTNEPPPANVGEVSLHLLVPAFMISELRTGFEMGFLVFLPFVLVDLIVATILTAMGMMMLPPTMISMPLKLLLFVAVDGWALLTRSIVASFT